MFSIPWHRLKRLGGASVGKVWVCTVSALVSSEKQAEAQKTKENNENSQLDSLQFIHPYLDAQKHKLVESPFDRASTILGKSALKCQSLNKQNY